MPRPLTSSRGGANAWLRLRSFDSSALVFFTDQNLSGCRAAVSWKGGAPVWMKGAMREAALSDARQVGHIVHHCAGEWGADCSSKVLGRCERGGKGRWQARRWPSHSGRRIISSSMLGSIGLPVMSSTRSLPTGLKPSATDDAGTPHPGWSMLSTSRITAAQSPAEDNSCPTTR